VLRTGLGLGDGVNRQRLLRFRLKSEYVRVRDMVRERARVGAPVWQNMINMPKSAFEGRYKMGGEKKRREERKRTKITLEPNAFDLES